jgi:hypothetical protein
MMEDNISLESAEEVEAQEEYMLAEVEYTQAQVLHTEDNMAQEVLHKQVAQAEVVAQAECKSAEVDNMVQEQEYTLVLDLANCKQAQVLHTLAQEQA